MNIILLIAAQLEVALLKLRALSAEHDGSERRIAFKVLEELREQLESARMDLQ